MLLELSEIRPSAPVRTPSLVDSVPTTGVIVAGELWNIVAVAPDVPPVTLPLLDGILNLSNAVSGFTLYKDLVVSIVVIVPFSTTAFSLINKSPVSSLIAPASSF